MTVEPVREPNIPRLRLVLNFQTQDLWSFSEEELTTMRKALQENDIIFVWDGPDVLRLWIEMHLRKDWYANRH